MNIGGLINFRGRFYRMEKNIQNYMGNTGIELRK